MKAVQLDLDAHLISLQRLLLMKKDQSLPVAFATNTLYVLARNNMLANSGSLAHDHLIPLIHQKKQWLHAEGVAHAAHALASAKIWDEDVWKLIKQKISEKDFDYEVVRSARFDPIRYYKMKGSEHFF